jgi:hypothetical protein
MSSVKELAKIGQLEFDSQVCVWNFSYHSQVQNVAGTDIHVQCCLINLGASSKGERNALLETDHLEHCTAFSTENGQRTLMVYSIYYEDEGAPLSVSVFDRYMVSRK